MAVDLLEDWRRYEKALLQKLKNREQELLDLHTEYMELQAKLGRYRKFAEATIARRTVELANAEIERLRGG